MAPKALRLQRKNALKDAKHRPVLAATKPVSIVVVKRTPEELILDKIKHQTGVIATEQGKLDQLMNVLSAYRMSKATVSADASHADEKVRASAHKNALTRATVPAASDADEYDFL